MLWLTNTPDQETPHTAANKGSTQVVVAALVVAVLEVAPPQPEEEKGGRLPAAKVVAYSC